MGLGLALSFQSGRWEGKPKIKRSAACSLSGKHKDPSERIKGSTRLEVGVSEFVSRVQTQ